MSKALSLFEPTLFRPFHNMLNDLWDGPQGIRSLLRSNPSGLYHTYEFEVGNAKSEDISVDVKGGRMCVTAKSEHQEKSENQTYSEFFERSWSCEVPKEATGEPEATLSNGRLVVQFPIGEPSQVKKIEVKKS